MKVSELAQKTGLAAINEYKDREIESVYISDMVSDLIASAKTNSVVVTLANAQELDRRGQPCRGSDDRDCQRPQAE